MLCTRAGSCGWRKKEEGSLMSIPTSVVAAALSALGGCALTASSAPDFAAKNRPPEQRCVRLQRSSASTPGRPLMTQAEIQAEAQAAALRGELDKVCDWL
jgi:hypothetical protein